MVANKTKTHRENIYNRQLNYGKTLKHTLHNTVSALFCDACCHSVPCNICNTWLVQTRVAPDLGLQIRLGPGLEPNVLELET